MGTPRYLREKRKEERMIRVRFRLGNEMKEGKYWEDEGKRKCRICGCMREGEGRGRERILDIKKILNESKSGKEWMRRLQER